MYINMPHPGGVCPNCGYCPTCGRRYAQPWPYTQPTIIWGRGSQQWQQQWQNMGGTSAQPQGVPNTTVSNC